MNDQEIIKLLGDWEYLNNQIAKFTEEELRMLVNYECSTKRRRSFIERLHQRYSKLKTARERESLVNGGLL